MPPLDPLDKILNVRKPIGWTSYDVIRWLRRRLSRIKMGHAGTLDPFAEGVLLVGLGSATKRISHLMNLEKEYEVRMTLGVETDTLDLTGRVTARKPVPQLRPSDLQSLCEKFAGEIEQQPPAFSAVKVNGVRSYVRARRGESVALRNRRVHIYALDIIDYKSPDIVFRVICSKGTYIRSLARDMAESVGTAAFLRMLRRTRIGTYQLVDSMELNDRFFTTGQWTSSGI